MNIGQILVSAGISALVTIILGLIIKRPLERRADAAEKRAEQERLKAEKLAEEESKKQKAVMKGVQAMLRDRLLQGYKYYEQQGYADYDDRKNMENMYSAYHGLGENGVMDDMQKKFNELPQHL
jgi:uncharacterized membrane protein YhiD involved in acid resistance